MFPAMEQPGVQEYIDRFAAHKGILAWKMAGAGGGGYLALVCRSTSDFPSEALSIRIRRQDS